MSVYKRKTTAGTTTEFHYRFMKNGKNYSGVCSGCEDEISAKAFEKNIKEKASQLETQKTVKALVENFKVELLGDEPIRLAEAFEKSQEIPRKYKAAPKHLGEKKSRFNDFICFMRDKYPDIKFLHFVTSKHANAYIVYIREHGRYVKDIKFKTKSGVATYKSKNTKLAPSTINRYHDSVREVFSTLNNYDDTLNPFANIPQLDDDYENREAFTQKELELILDKAPDFVKAIFVVGFFTAFREGDIATLKWSDVLFDHGIIRRKLLKTGVLVEVPIMPPLLDFLKRQIGNDDVYVLPTHADMYLNNPSGITYRVKDFLEDDLNIKTTKKVPNRTRAVSIKDVHSLRHTFCYFAGLANIPLVIVQSIVGHMTGEMTSHYMAHADRKAKREKLALLPCFSSLVKSTKRTVLVMQQRYKIIEKIQSADTDTVNEIYNILFPISSKKLLPRNTKQEIPKL